MSNNRWNSRYIVSVKCCFSKFCWLFLIQNKNADDIYAVLYVLFQKEGCPDILQSDNGSEFIADIIIKLCHDFGVRVVHGRPHHPQSQGQIENQNKVIKRHLARYLQTLTAMTQAACWPILLPFVADVINNTPSTTTNDIPFRLYKNREPKSFVHFIVPEGQFVVSSMDKTAVEDYIFSENDLKDATEKFESVDENDLLDSVGQLSAASIAHSCAGVIAPLFSHRKFADNFAGVGKKRENSIAAQSFQSEDSVESEFSTQSFNSALLQINDEWNVTRLQALEATEHTIHRNILHSLNKTKFKDFKKGDKVILSNPKLNLASGLHHQSRDPVCPLNVIGIITDILPGGMFKVKINDDDEDELAVRSVFAGQMALFRGDSQIWSFGEDDRRSEHVTVKEIHDSISAFAFTVHKEIYKKKLKLSFSTPNESVGAQFDILYHCLDCGVLSSLFALVGDEASSTVHYEQFTNLLTSLQNTGFRYFLYGTISWENHRKLTFGPKIENFLSSVTNKCEEQHDCIKCLSGPDNCQHACCQSLALKFVVKCGLVDVGDNGMLRLEKTLLPDQPNLDDGEPPLKKRKVNKKTCRCSDSCLMNPGKCGFHRKCCIRLKRKCNVASHKGTLVDKSDAGKSKNHPITVDNKVSDEPHFNFTSSLEDVWQQKVPGPVIVAEQHGCSVTSDDLNTLKPRKWVNHNIIDYIGKDLMSECSNVFIAEALLVECLREDKYNHCLPVDFHLNKGNYEKYVFPVHTLSRDHWWRVLVDVLDKQYLELDSLNVMRRDSLLQKKICQWFEKNVGIDIGKLKLLSDEDRRKLPSQGSNGTECGLFLLSFMMAVSFNSAFNFKLHDMPEVRRNLGMMILMGGRSHANVTNDSSVANSSSTGIFLFNFF